MTVLEIGCFSGYSALAWYEGTKDTQAEIVTLELSPKMIAASRRAFQEYGVEDRVKLIEGPADQTYVSCQDSTKDSFCLLGRICCLHSSPPPSILARCAASIPCLLHNSA